MTQSKRAATRDERVSLRQVGRVSKVLHSAQKGRGPDARAFRPLSASARDHPVAARPARATERRGTRLLLRAPVVRMRDSLQVKVGVFESTASKLKCPGAKSLIYHIA